MLRPLFLARDEEGRLIAPPDDNGGLPEFAAQGSRIVWWNRQNQETRFGRPRRRVQDAFSLEKRQAAVLNRVHQGLLATDVFFLRQEP